MLYTTLIVSTILAAVSALAPPFGMPKCKPGHKYISIGGCSPTDGYAPCVKPTRAYGDYLCQQQGSQYSTDQYLEPELAQENGTPTGDYKSWVCCGPKAQWIGGYQQYASTYRPPHNKNPPADTPPGAEKPYTNTPPPATNTPPTNTPPTNTPPPATKPNKPPPASVTKPNNSQPPPAKVPAIIPFPNEPASKASYPQ
ncbi:hypothetical protein FKW77_002846 [Venturia effusa]|uniref:Uncharacterized protein n=1 Tax=Venturia effusa TaxID=50376 RepID=A0A517L2W1_9PEZI|nr:hypothetical protein FKW77_002846 [Venturia effusa]